jgi:hypothetical protein
VLWAGALLGEPRTLMPQLVKGLPGQFRAPLQLHRGLDRLDALAPRSNGHIERGLEAQVGFDQPRVLIRRGNG